MRGLFKYLSACLGMFPFVFVFGRELIPDNFSFADDALLLGWVLAIIVISALGYHKLIKPPFVYVAFLFSCAISFLINLDVSRLSFQLFGFLIFSKNFVVLYVGYLLGRISSKSRFVGYSKLFIFLSMATSLIVIFQNIFPQMHNALLARDYGEVSPALSFRKMAYFGNPGVLAEILAIGSILSLFFWRASGRRLYLFVAFVIAAGVFGTFSRMAFFVLLLSSIIFLYLTKRSWLTRISVVSLFLIIGALSFEFSDQWRNRADEVIAASDDVSALFRIKAYLVAYEVFPDYPLWGTGPASFGSAIAEKSQSPIELKYGLAEAREAFGSNRPTTVDTYWPHLFVEYGAVNFLILMALLAHAAKCIPGGDEPLHYRSYLMAALVIGAIFNAFTSFNFETAASGLVTLYLLGLHWGECNRLNKLSDNLSMPD